MKITKETVNKLSNKDLSRIFIYWEEKYKEEPNDLFIRTRFEMLNEEIKRRGNELLK